MFSLNDYPIEMETNEIKNEEIENEIDKIVDNDCLDLGVVIRREDNHQQHEEIVKEDNEDAKWKRTMFKHFKKILNDDKKTRYKMLRKFIKKKLKKFGRKYALFMIRIRKLFIKKFKCKKFFVKIKKILLDDYLK